MTFLQSRLIIALDEWAGIIAMLTLIVTGHEGWVKYVFVPWAIMVYGISYPLHWRALYRAHKGIYDEAGRR